MSWKKYWDEELETMSPSKLEVLEEKKLRQQIEYCFATSSFYRDKMQLAGIKLEDIQCKQDLSKFPFTTKDEIRENQETESPYGGYLSSSPEKLKRVHGTSGTTGRFILTCFTQNDVRVAAECGARSLWTAGMRPDDTVFHVFNYSIYVGGLTDHLSAEYLGATVVPIGVGQSQAFISLAKDIQPTVITSTPSYPVYLAKKLRDEYGMEPKELGLKKGLFGGEPGAGIPATRKRLEEMWGFEARDANYGLGEVLAIFASECEAEDGLHFCGQGALIVELIDPDTADVKKIEAGAEGELVLTTLEREATPLIRYRTRDFVRVVTTEPCSCGRTSFRFKVIGRSDDMLWVRGVNVFPKAIEETVMKLRPQVTGEHQIILDREGAIDILPLKIEYAEHIELNHLDKLRKFIEDRFSDELRVTTKVELVPSGSLPTFEKKAKRIKKVFKGE
ncbi:AMP-binding protein [Metallumcola ferriviriculae]|uniref:AMP-binding protein n=1 Tax=Metallumcola ferriviriculae TaxID=3039180 RepID=A0AAU0UPA4_9FIRM|nr:AMP-binding protein [Desulfitibacteraceae bacterium MK1]